MVLQRGERETRVTVDQAQGFFFPPSSGANFHRVKRLGTGPVIIKIIMNIILYLTINIKFHSAQVNAGRATSSHTITGPWEKQISVSALETTINPAEPMTGIAWARHSLTWCTSSVS